VELAVKLPVLFREHGQDRAHRFLPALALVAHAGAERMQLGGAGRLSHAELDATA
jgi:hypothetical protein